ERDCCHERKDNRLWRLSRLEPQGARGGTNPAKSATTIAMRVNADQEWSSFKRTRLQTAANVTGLSVNSIVRRLEMLRQLVPDLHRLAVRQSRPRSPANLD